MYKVNTYTWTDDEGNYLTNPKKGSWILHYKDNKVSLHTTREDADLTLMQYKLGVLE